jgi:RNA-directed DNA polymerase
MHENREISCTSWSKDQDRSAKAINRTADVHVQEKSDCAIVPVNWSNKEGQPSREAGEGRVQTEKNIVQSRMPPTQSGTRMSQGLDGVRRAASVRKQERFTALLHHVTLNLLRDSFFDFKGFSYGFRPGRGPHQALDALTVGIQRKRGELDT